MLVSCGYAIKADMFVFFEQSYLSFGNYIMVTLYSNWGIFVQPADQYKASHSPNNNSSFYDSGMSRVSFSCCLFVF